MALASVTRTVHFVQRGEPGFGVKKINTDVRNFTLNEWQHYGTIGHVESWSYSSAYDNSHINVGDTAYLVGYVTDVFDASGNPVSACLYGKVNSLTPGYVNMTTTQLVMGGSKGDKGEDGVPSHDNIFVDSNFYRLDKWSQATQEGTTCIDSVEFSHVKALHRVYTESQYGYNDVAYQNAENFDVKLRKNTTYTLSCYAKADIPDSRMQLILYRQTPNFGVTREFVLTDKYKLYSVTFTTTEIIPEWAGFFRVMAGGDIYVCKPKLEEGDTATEWCLSQSERIGAKMRSTDWTIGKDYSSGKEGQEFYDVVVYESHLYLCVKSHRSYMNNNPKKDVAENGGLWEIAQDWAFIATKLLLTEKIKADMIETTNMTVNRLQTQGEAKIYVHDGVMEVFGKSKAHPNIMFGVDTNGMAVMRYYNNEGQLLYDLGPDGICKTPNRPESWNPIVLKALGTDIDTVLKAAEAYKMNNYEDGVKYHIYYSAIILGIIEDKVNNGKTYKGTSKVSGVIDDGWYCEVTPYGEEPKDWWETFDREDETQTPPDVHPSNPTFDTGADYTIYLRTLLHYTDGRCDQTITAYWSELTELATYKI